MAEEQTWRELLGEIISDLHERQRIADTLGINPITLTRWITGKSKPRPDSLRPLLDALPRYRVQLSELIAKEFVDFDGSNPSAHEGILLIPSPFYAHVISVYSNSPAQLRASSVAQLIMQQMLSHLDPLKHGIAIIIAQCVNPVTREKIYSLRQTYARATGSWHSQIEHQTHFLGAESMAGHAIIAAHPLIVQNHQEKLRLFPNHTLPLEESCVAYPILLTDSTVGSLYIGSVHPNFFSQPRLDLIQNYVDLLVLAFEPHEFYDLHRVEPGVMPDDHIQDPVLQCFQQMVTQYMLQAAQSQERITRPQVEALVWQELEERLLRHPYALDM